MGLFLQHQGLIKKQSGAPVLNFNTFAADGTKYFTYANTDIENNGFFSAWVNCSNSAQTRFMLLHGTGMDLSILKLGSGIVQMSSFNGSTFNSINGPNIHNAGWTHILGYWTGTQIGLFINGVSIGTLASTNAFSAGNSLSICHGSVGNEVYTNGSMCNASMHEYVGAPPQSLVDSIYNGGTPLQPWNYSATTRSTIHTFIPMNSGIASGREFVDFSDLAITGTLTGSPDVSGIAINYGNVSNKFNAFGFNGIDKDIDLGNDPSLQFTSVFSMDGWIYRASSGTRHCIASKWNFSGNQRAISFEINNGSQGNGDTLTLSLSQNGTSSGGQLIHFPSVTIDSGRWYHVAAVVNGSFVRIYVDGQQVLETAHSASIHNSTEQFIIGSVDSSAYFNGSMTGLTFYNYGLSGDDVKFLANQNTPKTYAERPGSLKTAVGAWELSSRDFTANDISGTGNNGTINGGATADGSEINYDDTRTLNLLLHYEGPDTSTTFIDSGCTGHAVTALGNAQITTSQFKFGASSLSLNRTLNTGLSVGVAGASDFNFSIFDYTIDTWIRFNSLPAAQQAIMTWGFDSTLVRRSWVFSFNGSSNNLEFYQSSDGSTLNSNALRSWSPAINTWYHVAVSRNGSVLRLFVDGVQLGANATAIDLFNVTDRPLYIGRDNDGLASLNFDGWIDETRIVKGIGLYTQSFTPPVNPYEDC